MSTRSQDRWDIISYILHDYTRNFHTDKLNYTVISASSSYLLILHNINHLKSLKSQGQFNKTRENEVKHYKPAFHQKDDTRCILK